MAPSITIGAVILLWRKAATKVIVSHDPSGTVPITLAPLGARPLSRVRFVKSLRFKSGGNRFSPKPIAYWVRRPGGRAPWLQEACRIVRAIRSPQRCFPNLGSFRQVDAESEIAFSKKDETFQESQGILSPLRLPVPPRPRL